MTDFPTLASDFLGFEADLADHEREALVALREHAEQSIRPLVNDAWEAAAFPHEINRIDRFPRLAKGGKGVSFVFVPLQLTDSEGWR